MKIRSMETGIGKTLIYFLSLQALGSQKTVRQYYLTLVPSSQGEQGDFIHLAKVMIPVSTN